MRSDGGEWTVLTVVKAVKTYAYEWRVRKWNLGRKCETSDSPIRTNVKSSRTFGSDLIKPSAQLFSIVPRLLSIRETYILSAVNELRETDLRYKNFAWHIELKNFAGNFHSKIVRETCARALLRTLNELASIGSSLFFVLLIFFLFLLF